MLAIVSSFSSVSCSAVKDVPGSVPCLSELLRLFIIYLFCLFLQYFFLLLLTMMHLSLKSPSLSSITISESESGSMHNMTIPLLWSNINSSLWHHSMFSFNFNDFLFCNVIYVLDLSFNGVTQHFSYVRWYSRIMFFNFKFVYITKTGYLSFGSVIYSI